MPHAKMIPMLDSFILTPLWVDARFGKWDVILTKPEPARELRGTHAMWRYTRTLALATRGEREKAVAERELFAVEAQAFPPNALFGEFNTAKDVLGMATHILDARIAMAGGNKDESIRHWRTAVEIQDTLNYDEPPDWYYPVRESLGGALLAAGRPADAEQVFREDLKRNPRNPRSLFGLMHSLQAQQKEADAAWVQKQFDSAWKNADTQLEASGL
jgi:tetratricopeptide (TPR) repeat protein